MIALALLAVASPFQDTAAIDVAVAAFTGAPVGAEGGARAVVDARLRLARCPLPQLDWRSPAQDAVVVRCDAPAWRIFVPVRRSVALVRPQTAAAAEPVIRRGDPVTLEAGSAGFAITREGVAMGDAPAGGRLLVKVDPAKPPVQAQAIEPGRATLPGFAR